MRRPLTRPGSPRPSGLLQPAPLSNASYHASPNSVILSHTRNSIRSNVPAKSGDDALPGCSKQPFRQQVTMETNVAQGQLQAVCGPRMRYRSASRRRLRSTFSRRPTLLFPRALSVAKALLHCGLLGHLDQRARSLSLCFRAAWQEMSWLTSYETTDSRSDGTSAGGAVDTSP